MTPQWTPPWSEPANSVFAVEGDWADRALDHVGIDLDPAVVEEGVKARTIA